MGFRGHESTTKMVFAMGPTLPFLLNIVTDVLQKLILGSFHLGHLTGSPTPLPQIFPAWSYNMAGDSLILARATPHTSTHLCSILVDNYGVKHLFSQNYFYPHERLRIRWGLDGGRLRHFHLPFSSGLPISTSLPPKTSFLGFPSYF